MQKRIRFNSFKNINPKAISIAIIFLAFNFPLSAQTNGKVEYLFVNKYPSTNSVMCRKATLFFTRDSSLFIHGKAKELGEEKSYWSDSLSWFKENSKSNILKVLVEPTGQGVFKNFRKGYMQFRKLFFSEAYTVEEPVFPKLKWTISDEKKLINKFECQKATAIFRGRNYIAWFAPSIPIQDGPWKLTGCPGLILEAYDDADEVLFLFSSIEYPSVSNKESIVPFPVTTKHTFEEFKIAPEVEFEKMKRRNMSASNAPGNMEIKRVPVKQMEVTF